MLAGRGMFRTPASDVNLKGRIMSTITPSPWKTLWRAISSVLLPPTCCLCGARGESQELDLCEVCVTLLPLMRAPRARMRGEGTAGIWLFAPFEYAYPVDAWVRALKFSGDRVYARVLGVLLARARATLQAEAPELRELPELIVPVPLHSTRYRERGFNQAAEIARVAGSALQIPVDRDALIRRFATREQSGLSVRKRHKNVRRAFAVARPISAKHIALVDDVVTTGSTALAAAHALAAQGVRQVEVWAAAYAVLSKSRRTTSSKPLMTQY